MGSDKVLHLLFLYSDIYLRHIGSKRLNFNPRSPHGERPAHQSEDDDKPHISIHAPRMGSDFARTADCSHGVLISIHAPRMGSDRIVHEFSTKEHHFNPRPPHGERPYAQEQTYTITDFNPRPPHGERLVTYRATYAQDLFQSTPPAWGATTVLLKYLPDLLISIHAPRMGSDIY